MAGTFQVEWLPGGVLLQRRTGMLTVEEAQEYAAAVRLALQDAPERWGAVVDTRDAAAQVEAVQSVIQDLIQDVVAHGVLRVALVSASVVTGLQQRRVTTSPGMHDPATIATFDDIDEAVAHVRAVVAG